MRQNQRPPFMFVICATLVHGTLGSATSPIAAEPDWEKQRLRWERLTERGWKGGLFGVRVEASCWFILHLSIRGSPDGSEPAFRNEVPILDPCIS